MSTTPHEPRCGMCRYPVRGLPTFRCPECGNDLRKVGIIATGVRAHATPWQRIGYWTLLFIVAAIPLIALADNHLRWRQSNITITLRDLSGTRDISLTVLDTGYGWPIGQRTVSLQIGDPMFNLGWQRLEVRASSLSYRLVSAGGMKEGSTPLNEQVILDLWPPVTTATSTKQEALDLLAMIKAAARDGDLRRRPPVYFEQLGYRYTGAGSGSNTALMLAALVILWTMGALIAWRRSPRP